MAAETLIQRRLTIDDYASIVALWGETDLGHKPSGRDSRDNILREMESPDNLFYGAFIDDRLVGVIIANFDRRRGWINRLAVHPDVRGKGLAGELIAAAETFLHERGALVIAALIEDYNAASISAFSKSGYSCLDSIKYYSKRPSWDV
jgi:ribosomal protein S18 acetylase RimI-like enzyme